MITSTTSERRDFEQCVELLLKLHTLALEGRDESEEADAIRDAMDTPWYRLSEEEAKLLRGLSADLYSVGVDRAAPTSEPDEAAWRRFTDAANREDWPLALDLVREVAADLPPEQVAYIRGACWAYLRQPAVAIVFLRENQRLKPLDVGEEVLLFTCLIQANRLNEALPRAREIAADREAPAALLLKAAEVLFIEASQSPGSEAEPLHRHAIHIAQRGLKLGEAGETDKLFESLRFGAWVHLALSYDQLGQKTDAIQWCERALDLDRNHPDAQILHAHLTSGEYPHSETHRRLVADPRSLTPIVNLTCSK